MSQQAGRTAGQKSFKLVAGRRPPLGQLHIRADIFSEWLTTTDTHRHTIRGGPQSETDRQTDRGGGRQTDTGRNAVGSDKTGKEVLSGVAMTTTPFHTQHRYTHINTRQKRGDGKCLCVIVVECVQIRYCFV